MWPFSKKTSVHQNPISYSQVDITERFDDNQNTGSDEWIKTVPLNLTTKNPESVGLPSIDSSPKKIYGMAKKLSSLREQANIPTDGVYCPVCHIANKELASPHTPCPKCGRELLKFGWD